MFVFDINVCMYVFFLLFVNFGGFGNKLNLFVLKCIVVVFD